MVFLWFSHSLNATVARSSNGSVQVTVEVLCGEDAAAAAARAATQKCRGRESGEGHALN